MKKLMSIILVLCMALGLCVTTAWAESTESCDGGSSCTHAAAIGDIHYDTLKEAADAATEGATILILKSTNETLPVPVGDNVTYTAKTGVELSGGTSNGWWNKSVTFSGLVFKDGAAVSVHSNSGTHTCIVKNCTFENVTAAAVKQGVISISGYANVEVTGNKITNVVNYTGVNGSNSQDESCGIYITGATGTVKVTENSVDDVKGTGIYVNATGEITITKNVISQWGGGGADRSAGRAIRTDNGSKLTVTDNKMTDSTSNEEYVKSTNVASDKMDVSNNYWGGNDPTTEGVFAMSGEDDVTLVLKSYYADAAMQNTVSLIENETPDLAPDLTPDTEEPSAPAHTTIRRQNTAVTTTDTTPADTTKTDTVTSAKTFDAGVAVYGMMAALSLLGMGYVEKKR